MKDLAGRVAVITGGGSGIGLATACRLAGLGMRVVVSSSDQDRVDAAVRALAADGLEVLGVRADVADFADVQRLAAATLERYGRVNVALLNAGFAGGGSLLDDDLEPWRRSIGVNLWGVVYGIKAFVPLMLRQGDECHVIATSSGSGAVGTLYGNPSYAATKAAVVTVMESLYGQLRDMGANVHAGVLLPPLTRTHLMGGVDMTALEAALRAVGVPSEIAEPEEVAEVVVAALRSNAFWALPPDGPRPDGTPSERSAWNRAMLFAKAASLADGTPPDPYLWGRFTPPS